MAATAVAAMLAGCGSGTVDRASTDSLHEPLADAREALDAGDESAAGAALDRFASTVRRLADAGDLHAEDAKVLLARADHLSNDVERARAAEAEKAAVAQAAAQAEAEAAAQADQAARERSQPVVDRPGPPGKAKAKKPKKDKGR